MADPGDVGAMLDGMGLASRLVAHPALARFYGPLITPWSERVGGARPHDVRLYHHGAGTCRMGPTGDPGAVVDERLRVHGLDNLWVADASVLPVVPHANTNFGVIVVGEVAAALLGGREATAGPPDRRGQPKRSRSRGRMTRP